MKIVAENVAILEISEESVYLVSRSFIDEYLLTHTKQDLLKYILNDLNYNGFKINRDSKRTVMGELWCLFEEWGIADFVEKSWLKINWEDLSV